MRFQPSRFFRAGSFTILVILPRRLIRADFACHPPILRQLWQSDAPMGETLPVLADAAFALGPGRRTAVYLFTTACWTGVVPLSSAKASTLSAIELVQALGFEAETLSSVSPFDSLLAATPLAAASAGERQFWVTQASRSELGAVEDTLRRRGARLAGFAHPGGLPQPMSAAAGASWRRTELWGDSAVCVDRGNEGGLQLQVFAAASGHGDRLHEAKAWFAARGMTGAGELLVAPGLPPIPATPATDDLNVEARLATWLTTWARELTGRAPGAPLLRPPSRPMSGQRRFALSAACAGVAIGLCAAHWTWLRRDEAALQRDLGIAQASATSLDAAKSRARARAQSLTNASQRLLADQRLQQDWETVTRQERRRHSVLLHALADAASDDWVLQGLAEAAGETRISILSIRPELPHFTERLAAAMAPLDWRVGPPNRQALNISPEGGPWQLNWTIRAVDVTNRQAQASDASPASGGDGTGGGAG